MIRRHPPQWHARRHLAEHNEDIADSREDEIKANSVNLPAFLSSRGYDVKKESNFGDYSLSGTAAGSFGLRFSGNVWFAYQTSSDFKGNSVMLIEEINGCNKNEAIRDILGQFKLNPKLADNSKAKALTLASRTTIALGLPTPRPHDIAAGRLYLASRGIDVSTFEMLRKSGSAEYAWDGVAFIGKQASGLPGMIETRLFNKLPVKDKPGKFRSHSVKTGSDRTFPVVIVGTCSDVAIVEGNFDGLGLYEINSRNLSANKQPVIIIAGGKDNAKMFTNPDIIAILANAKNIQSWSDNEVLNIADFNDVSQYQEALANKQANTNKAHEERAAYISAINPAATIVQCLPPVGVHDLADLNKQIKATLPKPASKFKF